MKKIIFGTIGLLMLGAAAPAFAADLPMVTKAPLRAIAYNWNGMYAGGNVGYSWGKWDSTGTVPNGSDSPSVNGIIGGLQLGYNWMAVNRWLLGLEADIQISGERKSNDWTTPGFVGVAPGGTPVNNTWRFPWFGTARARVGYAPDNWLLYVTGGLAFGEVKSSLTTPTLGVSDSSTKLGWTLGGGVEYAFAPRWTAKVEYLYLNLGSRVFFAGTTTPVSSNLHDNIVRVGVNYKFN